MVRSVLSLLITFQIRWRNSIKLDHKFRICMLYVCLPTVCRKLFQQVLSYWKFHIMKDFMCLFPPVITTDRLMCVFIECVVDFVNVNMLIVNADKERLLQIQGKAPKNIYCD